MNHYKSVFCMSIRLSYSLVNALLEPLLNTVTQLS